MNALTTIQPAGPRGAPDAPSPGAQPVPASAERARHTVLTPRAQAAFLAKLAEFGNVRLACRAASVSPQTAYRARRRAPAFAHHWDAALLAARTHAESVLAERAIDGWEEQVFYHGEEVARRRRFSDRLLLAHLARLDRLEASVEVSAALHTLDAAIDALEKGRELPEPAGEAGGGEGAAEMPQEGVPGVPSCRKPAAADPLGAPCDCPGAEHGADRGRPHWEMTADGPAPVVNVGEGTGPCCDAPRWPECRDCVHFPAVERMLSELEEAEAAAQDAADD